MRVVSIGSGG
jgi:hypothetical protein